MEMNFKQLTKHLITNGRRDSEGLGVPFNKSEICAYIAAYNKAYDLTPIPMTAAELAEANPYSGLK
jgi:hypothetical protein